MFAYLFDMNYFFRKEDWIVDYLKKQKKTKDKSYELANKFRLEGNSFFKRKQDDRALEKYNEVGTSYLFICQK